MANNTFSFQTFFGLSADVAGIAWCRHEKAIWENAGGPGLGERISIGKDSLLLGNAPNRSENSHPP